jgi:hypothetical protein
VKIDVSALPEERFPAVVWLYQRRTYAWKTTGGYLPPVAEAAVPPRGEPKLGKLKRSEAIPHVIPLLFTGPKAATGTSPSRGVDAAAGVAGGMANGLLRDALRRESGGLGSLTQNIAPAPTVAPAESSPNVSNVTYVYITSPPHTPSSDALPMVSPSMPGGYYAQTPTGAPAMFATGAGAWGPAGYAIQPTGTYNPATGTTYDRAGQATYDPATGMTLDAYGRSISPEIDPMTGAPVYRIRRPPASRP